MGRAQLSLEFIMILAISLLMLTVAVVVLLEFTRDIDDTASFERLQELGFAIVDDAKNVYVYGEDSFVTIHGNLPEDIHKIYTVEDSTLVFELHTSRGPITIPVFSEIPINGTVDDGLITYVNSSGISVGSGRATFTIISRGNYVEIRYQ